VTQELISKVSIPEGQSGVWRVETFTVSESEAKFENLRAMFGGGRPIAAGRYTRLMRGGYLVMSDTPAEMRDHYVPVLQAKGSVLITGLGLGMVAAAILRRDGVADVTVIEKSPDVIALVAPHMSDPRLTIIEADAYTWRPPKGKRYDVVWHDIWDDICADNLDGMARLHRKYARRCEWQGSWAERLCRRSRGRWAA
jgi:hypothetical protein